MAITAAYLRTRFRSEMDDTLEPYLWTDDDINDYMDQAQEEFCRRIDCIPDNESFTLKLKAKQTHADVEDSITQIRGGRIDGNNRYIEPATVQDMRRGTMLNDYGDYFAANWRQAEGTVMYLVTDDVNGQVRPVPVPAEDVDIKLDTYRIPETRIVDGGELEIPDKFRRKLLLKMRALGYLKSDSETYNKNQADVFEARWEAAFDGADRDYSRYKGGSRTTTYGGV